MALQDVQQVFVTHSTTGACAAGETAGKGVTQSVTGARAARDRFSAGATNSMTGAAATYSITIGVVDVVLEFVVLENTRGNGHSKCSFYSVQRRRRRGSTLTRKHHQCCDVYNWKNRRKRVAKTRSRLILPTRSQPKKGERFLPTVANSLSKGGTHPTFRPSDFYTGNKRHTQLKRRNTTRSTQGTKCSEKLSAAKKALHGDALRKWLVRNQPGDLQVLGGRRLVAHGRRPSARRFAGGHVLEEPTLPSRR